MSLVVPFDGSEMAEAALVRAAEFGTVFDESVLAVCVIPKGNEEYARDRGWIGPKEQYETDAVVSTLHQQVIDLYAGADFRHVVEERYATPGQIANRIRSVARNEDASMVFIGSENAGQLVSNVSSVGSSVAADEAYDVVIVRHRSPAKIAELRDASPHAPAKSDFYPTG